MKPITIGLAGVVFFSLCLHLFGTKLSQPTTYVLAGMTIAACAALMFRR